MSYIIFAMFCLMLYFLASALSKRQLKHAIAHMRRPVEITKIFCELLEIEEQVEKLHNENALAMFPLTSACFSDVQKLVDDLNGNLNIENIVVVSYSDCEGADKSALLKQEVRTLPDEIKKLFARRHICFMRLVLLKYSRTSYIICGQSVTKFDILFTQVKLSVLDFMFGVASATLKNTKIIAKGQAFSSSKSLLANEQINESIIRQMA